MHEIDSRSTKKPKRFVLIVSAALMVGCQQKPDRDQGRVLFAYRTGGEDFTDFYEGFLAKPGHWVGAHFGIFARSDSPDAGAYADFDYVRVAEGAQ